ncbi:MAG: gamma-glutamyl-gamma-aminobutyrate hydrolase family protein, partial [Terracidiphilus sp.]
MTIHIAIPEPSSSDEEYNSRSLPAYIEALEAAGASAVVIRLNQAQENVAKLLAGVQGILLPGSRFDV